VAVIQSKTLSLPKDSRGGSCGVCLGRVG